MKISSCIKPIAVTLLFALILLTPLINATEFGYNYLDNKDYVIEGANYSINVNNTDHFGGYSVSGFVSYIQGLFDSVYCKLTGCTMEGDINMGGYSMSNVNQLNMTGTFRQGEDGNMFIYDINNEIHHLNVDLERFDELRANTFTTTLNIETFSNVTGNYVNISSATGSKISFIGVYNGLAVSETFDNANYVLQLINGTNSTPALNRIYAYIDSGVPTWAVSITEPEVQHAMASRILLGDKGSIPYTSALQEDGDNGFLKRVQRRFRKEGLLYESGFYFNSTETDLTIGEGSYINGIYDQISNNSLNTSLGFYLVLNNGSYVWLNSFDAITEYSDGNTIGTNKYFNVIFGVTPYDGESNIYAVVQSKPNTEYTSTLLAYADNDNTLKVFPSDTFLKTFFLPVARVVLNQGNGANILPNGMYAEDYRGGIAGGANSGGGLAEADPIWSADKPYYLRNDSNINLTGYNITADYYFGDGSQLTGIPEPNLSAYWLNNGSSTATGNWDIDAYSFNSKNIYYDALKNNYLGDSATPSLTTGHDNFYLNGAGAKTTTAYDCIGIGDEDTLKEMTTSNRNIAIGAGALGTLTTSLYTQNIGVGVNAGRYYSTSSNTRPTRSMYFGHYTQASGATPTGEYVFGYSAIGKGSNTFTFGDAGVTTLKYYMFGDWINLKDDKYIALGAAEDMKIYYDGTNAIINPKAVGSGVLDIQGFTQVDGLNIQGTVKDASSSTSFQVHQSDENYWTGLFYNDAYSSSNAIFGYFGYNSGKFAQGTEVNTDLAFYTNGYSNERMVIKNNGNIEMTHNLTVAGVVTADDYITTSRVADVKDGKKSLDKLENMDEWLVADAKGDKKIAYDKHYAFKNLTKEVPDKSKPVYVPIQEVYSEPVISCKNETYTIEVEKGLFESTTQELCITTYVNKTKTVMRETYPFNVTVEKSGLSMETRVAEMEKMIYELKQQNLFLQEQINNLTGKDVQLGESNTRQDEALCSIKLFNWCIK